MRKDVQMARSRLGAPPDFGDLIGIALDAIKINPPLLITSVLGLPWTRLLPSHRYSEFRLLDVWRLGRTLRFLVNISLPAIPRKPPALSLPPIDRFFWQPTVILQRPDQYGSYTSYPREAWFFINGILTNDAVAQLNAAFISDLFHRPVTLIQNSTCSFGLDLLECMLGKHWRRTTESVRTAFPAIYDALKSEKQRVIVIAHSQGTIIASVVLQLLTAITRPQLRAAERPTAAEAVMAMERYAPPEFIYPEAYEIDLADFDPLTEEELAKLELYCFANCATTMQYLPTDRRIPWIESFGNAYDIVARLGMTAPRAAHWGIAIDGPRYERPGAWGHLLNEHYLAAIEKHQKVRHKRSGQGGLAPYRLVNPDQYPDQPAPRLFSYINGGSPLN